MGVDITHNVLDTVIKSEAGEIVQEVADSLS